MLKSSYYQATLPEFVAANRLAIFGELAAAHGFDLEQPQRDAWLAQVDIMKPAVGGLPLGHILFEFAIPRMGKRADAVLLIRDLVVVLEFKIGAAAFDRSAIEQVHDYALDLKNFHLGSHSLRIVPVLVATAAPSNQAQTPKWAADAVATPLLSNAASLANLLAHVAREATGATVDFVTWVMSGYRPTPTIIEAAQALYETHGVEEIARSDAGAQNLGATSDCIAEIIERSKVLRRKSICLVTGVPGAGKTLAGLNIATKRSQEHGDEHAVFLSGNGPLVAVLREALARDQSAREGVPKSAAHRRVASFVQNVHHFRDEAILNPAPPHEHVVVFDEAQRAWGRAQAAKFMKTKRSVLDFDKSEPEFLLSVMDRHRDWCVVVGLIGGGQEINTGEAGIAEWLVALRAKFSHWDVYISDQLKTSGELRDPLAVESLGKMKVRECPELHLAVSMRSFRAEALSAFVDHLVENRAVAARTEYDRIAARYPIVLTRNLDSARRWLRSKARGSERFGLLASSGAHRLRAEGLYVASQIEPPTWFLNDRADVRSCFYCEMVATEFDVQGLELDWAGVCWDADYRYNAGRWSSLRFRGTRWERVADSERQSYLKNAYRVILTRARQGMVIFVPMGSPEDPTRLPEYYDETFRFLRSCGLPVLGQ